MDDHDTPRCKTIYTEHSLANIREIRSYLLYKFTQKEVDNLYGLLTAFESVVAVFPELYPQVENGKIYAGLF